MARYPQQSFDAMRQDAIRRSREMQRRAVPQMPPEPMQPPIQTQNRPTGSGMQLPLPKDLQKILTDWDGEKLALLALLYLLYKEGAELELLIALAYIML